LRLHDTDATPAASLIASEIGAVGPIPFRRFMELALYAPEVGYYEAAGAGPGPQADYLTSPEIHAAFGALLCRLFESMWRRMGQPTSFWLIEGGPGTGAFAADVLATARAAFPDFAASLRLALAERSAALQQLQTRTLAPWTSAIRWLDPPPSSWEPLGPGCVFANELLDAFPVYRVAMRAEGLQEVHVGVDRHDFVEVQRPARRAVVEQLAAGGANLQLGDTAEVNVDAADWVITAAGLLTEGYVLVLDYGEPARTLYGSRHPTGTLRCFRRHVMSRDPYAHVGRQDVTAHVDLSAIMRGARSAGLTIEEVTRQGRLLRRLGLVEILGWLERCVPRRIEQRAHRAALGLLAEPAHLGRIASLLLGKSAPGGGLNRLIEEPVTTRMPPPHIWELRGDPLRLAESL
jgi:SAM-dependent MidA family methyltransferase